MSMKRVPGTHMTTARVLVAAGLAPTLVLVAAILAAAAPAFANSGAAAAAAGAPQAEPQTEPHAAPAAHETQASVPELAAFHEPIRILWHKAWPAKDFEMLAALLPEVEAGAAKVAEAELPGILRDKQAAWDEGVKNLGAIVTEYREAVGKKDLQATLDAAERLHSQFEMMVRVVRPPLKELDAFHQVLYKLYHYDYPEYDLEAIRASVKGLQDKMAGLEQATLHPRLQSKQAEFEAGRKELGAAVDDLMKILEAGKDKKTVEDAIEGMHDKYVALESVF
jgi:hypothetical protein